MSVSSVGFAAASLVGNVKSGSASGGGGAFASLVGAAGGGEAPDATDQAWELLKEMTGGGLQGYWKWMIKTMKERLRADVMGDMGVTDQSLAAMPEAQRNDIEQKINEEVERRLKAWMEKQLHKQQDTADTQAIQAAAMALTGDTQAVVDPGKIADGGGAAGESGDWLNPKLAHAQAVPGALAAPMTEAQLREAGYGEEDIVQRILRGRVTGEERAEDGAAV